MVAKRASADYPRVGSRRSASEEAGWMHRRLARARAPLRLGFGGGGTDVSPYCDQFGGVVLNAAIDLFAHASVGARDDGQVRLEAADRDLSWTGSAAAAATDSDPDLRLLAGVYARMCAAFAPGESPALTLTTYADCPPGSGLGSSSALVVAMVAAFCRYFERELDPGEIARLAYEIERRDLGLAGGRQDQYAAAYGGVNVMRFEGDERFEREVVAAPPFVLEELEESLVLYFTGVSRESAAIIDEQRKNMREGAPRSLEGLHKLKAGALSMREALEAGDLSRFGALLDAGWSDKKLTAGAISSAAIDEVYEAAKAYGVIGGKVTGAGGGGFMMFLIDPTRREGLKRLLAGFGGRAQGCRLEASGVRSWLVGQGGGAA
jgi:D-glycero-alpha-D-manno-heptose-7-phosphate kinase